VRRAAAILLSLVCLAISAWVLAAAPLTVQVRETKLRKEPKFWAPAVATLKAGDAVSETERQGDWIRGTARGASGWVHNSAVTTKTVVLTGGSTTASTESRSGDVSLAGKGFTDQVEREYRKEKAGGFEDLDRIPPPVSDTELETFLREGKLAEWAR
jgi:uncharacterized protein YraI